MKDQKSKPESAQPGAEQSTETNVEVVTVSKTKIQCCIDPDGKVFVVLKPICDAIGIHTDKAYNSIKQDTILGAKATVRWVLDAKNRKFPMQTLPIEYVHGWLFSIDASKVSANAKPKLLQFKKECYQVLFDHFYGKYRVYEQNLNERRQLQNEIHDLGHARASLSKQIADIKKRLSDINTAEISGQLTLNVKGGKA